MGSTGSRDAGPDAPTSASSDPQAAAARRALFAGLRRVYEDLDAELARLGPRCEQSGVCCDFERAGHTLFASSVEAAYLREHVDLEGGEPVRADRCPLITEAGLCGVRAHRALGCRVYFCDPRFAGDMPDVHERFYREVQRLWEEHGEAAGIAWAYRPWLDWIGEVAGDERPGREGA